MGCRHESSPSGSTSRFVPSTTTSPGSTPSSASPVAPSCRQSCAAEDAPMAGPSGPAIEACGVTGGDREGDGAPVGDDVEDGGAGPRLLHELAELVGRGVALDG